MAQTFDIFSSQNTKQRLFLAVSAAASANVAAILKNLYTIAVSFHKRLQESRKVHTDHESNLSV